MTESDGDLQDSRVRLDYARPCDALAPFVFGYHLYAVEAAPGAVHEDIGYPSWASIGFQTRGAPFGVRIGRRQIDPVPRATLLGPTSRAIFPRSGTGTVVGIGLSPLGWTRLFGGDADRHADRVTPLEAMLGDDAAMLSLALDGVEEIDVAKGIFDHFLLQRLRRPHRAEPMVAGIQVALAKGTDCSVSGLAGRLNLEPRRLARLAHAHFGFSPKLLLRRARFMRTLLKLIDDDGRPYVDKIDRSYHDQSHFVRDCKFFLSMSPRRFIKMKKPVHTASMVELMVAAGAAAQAPHHPALELLDG